MPYITQEQRRELKNDLDALADTISGMVDLNDEFMNLDGIMNYCITYLCKNTYPTNKYFYLNRLIGMLECCKLEMYREVVAPYEDIKKKENGVV